MAVETIESHATRIGEARLPAEAGPSEPSYYDISILQRPVWRWEIASYFFLGGLSAGAYILARVAERFGGEKAREVTRTGTLVSFIASLAGPPLLIKDLGDPKRFHHMLRVWKPSSPMNLGTWILSAYTPHVAASTLRELLRDRSGSVPDDHRLLRASFLVVHDAAGIPLAIMLASYTGVLLSCTANPLWCRNKWLSPLFTASAIATGAEAISLVLGATDRGSAATNRALDRITSAAHAAETLALGGFLRSAGPKAAALTRGGMKRQLFASVGGVLASEVLRALPARGERGRWIRILSAATGLAAGFALRWAIIYGGKEAAADPHTARLASRPA